MIFAVKRFEIHDGDGIRTTVFFKGCPLRCKWCHNPESFRMEKDLLREESGCTECGYEISMEALTEELAEDEIFYRESGGGVTISGGEPLLQAEDCRALLRLLKEKGIHTAVDTSGYVDRSAIDKVMEDTDVFLFDLKAADEEVHKACTGVSNRLILDNLHYIDSCNKPIEIRVPYVPQMNDNQMEGIAKIILTLKNVTKVRILKFHSMAVNKYTALGLEYPAADIPEPTDADIEKVIRSFRERGINAMETDDM